LILLDTNVISALMRTHPDAIVVEWLDAERAPDIWTTTITVFEIQFGIGLLPAGRRRDALELAARDLIERDLRGRVLPFDVPAARAAAALGAARQRRGRTVDVRDTQIAGIALARRARLATRNVRDFADLDVDVVDPWARAGR
jgi:hypothetical protein